MNNKMEIWNSVCKTDPKHTKKVAQRGGFTSIDAMYQVQRTTEQFGPCGQGWGYECEYSTLNIDDGVLVFCDLVLWWGDRKANYYGPVRGCNSLVAKGRLDDDAPKKALTDALTKALSHLGFSADVFLGLYDDNKYLGSITQEFSKKQADIDWAAMVGSKLGEAKTIEDLVDKWTKVQPHLEGRAQEAIRILEDAYGLATKQFQRDKEKEA